MADLLDFSALIRALNEWGRAPDHGAAAEIRRFCAACWPEQSARYRARWAEEDRLASEAFLRDDARPESRLGPTTWFESATWHNTLDLVRDIERQMIAPIPPSPEGLAALAAYIRAHAAERVGEMPSEVEGFLQRYGAPEG